MGKQRHRQVGGRREGKETSQNKEQQGGGQGKGGGGKVNKATQGVAFPLNRLPATTMEQCLAMAKAIQQMVVGEQGR